jgi:hypothetical protein
MLKPQYQAAQTRMRAKVVWTLISMPRRCIRGIDQFIRNSFQIAVDVVSLTVMRDDALGRAN